MTQSLSLALDRSFPPGAPAGTSQPVVTGAAFATLLTIPEADGVAFAVPRDPALALASAAPGSPQTEASMAADPIKVGAMAQSPPLAAAANNPKTGLMVGAATAAIIDHRPASANDLPASDPADLPNTPQPTVASVSASAGPVTTGDDSTAIDQYEPVTVFPETAQNSEVLSGTPENATTGDGTEPIAASLTTNRNPTVPTVMPSLGAADGISSQQPQAPRGTISAALGTLDATAAAVAAEPEPADSIKLPELRMQGDSMSPAPIVPAIPAPVVAPPPDIRAMGVPDKAYPGTAGTDPGPAAGTQVGFRAQVSPIAEKVVVFEPQASPVQAQSAADVSRSIHSAGNAGSTDAVQRPLVAGDSLSVGTEVPNSRAVPETLSAAVSAPISAAISPAAAPQASIAPVSSPAAAAPEPVSARPGEIGHQLGVEIARSSQDGRNDLTIRLDPVELGKIQVRIQFDDQGNLRAHVSAESNVALEMLRRDSGDLAKALNDAGIRTDSQSFQFEGRGQSREQHGQRQQPGGNNHQNNFSPEAEEHDQPQQLRSRVSGSLDLFA